MLDDGDPGRELNFFTVHIWLMNKDHLMSIGIRMLV